MISIVIPVAHTTPILDKIRKDLSVEPDIEVVLVVSPRAKEQIHSPYSNELVVVNQKQGRGYAYYKGLQETTGEIILFLHADTILPKKWRESILEKMKDSNIAGGGFSLAFDHTHWYFRFMVICSNIIFGVNKELWGDRAMFVRRTVVKSFASQLNIPIMEDVRLSGIIRRHGKIVILKEKVITSADAFIRHGWLWHPTRILIFRFWYALGGSHEAIYNRYYAK